MQWIHQAEQKDDDDREQRIGEHRSASNGWVDWYNHRRLHGSLEMVSPNEYEANYHAALIREPLPT